MPLTVTVPRDTWFDLGPVPIVVELPAGDPVLLVSAPAPPADLLATGISLIPGQSLFFGGEGRRVYARHALARGASLRTSTLDEVMAAPPPLDLGGAAGRALLSTCPTSYTLLAAATATGPKVSGIRGGDYVWRIEGAFSSGVTATLQFLGLDGATWKNVRNGANTADVVATGETQIPLGIGQGAAMRVLITGTQTAPLNSTLSGLS